jgi:CxxC motif-containing protein (DUF1111 family)
MSGCGDGNRDGATPADIALYAVPGAPLPALDSAARARFVQGQTLFHHEFTPEEGLGPLFNQKRCSSCHDLPALGGFGAETALKATHFDAATMRCDVLTAEGGDMLQQQATPLLQAAGTLREPLPEGATAVSNVRPPALFGLGLVETIPDSAFVALADSADVNGDGISGRTGRTADGRVGRFGRRAEFATLRDFIAGAAMLEMGLTSSLHATEQRVGRNALPAGVDPVPEPELADSALALLVDFVRGLALPERETATGALADTLRTGERAFRQARCDACHVPAMPAGATDLPVAAGTAVPIYSDLLLHDMGAEDAGICAPNASPSEYRTSPLAGLRLRQPFMHDGRAPDVLSALGLHGGEALASRQALDAMTPAMRDALLRFLRSL